MPEKRDYAADLAVCEAATPGPWVKMASGGIKFPEMTREKHLAIVQTVNVLPWYIRRVMELESRLAAPPPARWEAMQRVCEAMEELLEVAELRGDNDLPAPPDDPKLWTARMQDAWNEAEAAMEVLTALEGVGE